MDVQGLLLALLWLAAAPFAATGNAPSSSEWQPPVPVDPAAPPALDTPHFYVEHLHERWLPESIDWSAPRALAIDMVCDLGLISLSLMDCHGLLVAETPVDSTPDILILSPNRAATSAPGTDFDDVRRRPIRERMHSI